LQEKLNKEVFLPAVEKYFYIYEKKFQDSSFIVPSGLTWADFIVAEYFTTIHNIHPEVMAKFPSVEKGGY